jgi:hypothetical protein
MRKKTSGSQRKKSTRTTKKAKEASKGLGDSVEKVFKATGIDKVAKWVLGEDCGCDERKAKLNKLFPYVKPECLNEDEYQYLKEYVAARSPKINPETQKRLLIIYNRVFHERKEPTNCSPCFIKGVHNKLVKLYEEYKKDE